MKRIISTVLASAFCCWGTWQAAKIGFARTLDDYAIKQPRDIPTDAVLALAGVSDPKSAVDRAVTLLPADAETQAARAEVLQQLDEYAQARDEFQRAAQLRPRDYYLWMLLGVTSDQSGDQEGALRALRQAVALAPSYARPRWQLGNVLLRMGQLDQAFVELRQAALSNPSLWPNVDDLAWGIYGPDARKVTEMIRPETDSSHMALALLFAHHNQGAAGIDQFRATGLRSDKATEKLVEELFKARLFSDAYEVWANRSVVPAAVTLLPFDHTGIRDGSFEGVLTGGKFGWQFMRDVVNVTMSIDEGTYQSGARSLRIDFRGNSDPALALVTQIILVKPQTRYHLRLFALSKEFVSAGDPVISLADAADPKNVVLAQSPPLRSDPNVWREFAIDFTTRAETQAILITLARQACANNPCPAFGAIWLDSFSIEATK